MSDRPPKKPFEVVRRSTDGTSASRTVAPTVRPAGAPRPVRPVAPKPVSPQGTGAPSAAPTGTRPPPRGKPFGNERGGPSSFGGRGAPRFARSGPPLPPPTVDAINTLAKRERVPARIAKGELEGKMKCRIWKKLHAEEAKRFLLAYELMEKTPGLELADAFGVIQSGTTVDEFREKRARVKKKEEVKKARAEVSPQAIDDFLSNLSSSKTEISFVLGERSVVDVLTAIEPVAFRLEKAGRLEKLQVVLACRKTTWEKTGPHFARDAKLSQKPLPVARQPTRRPVSDPRPFLPFISQRISLLLRNGLRLELPLLSVGPFDILLGEEGDELFVPLHGVVRWEPAAE